jgi:hypothetical protein
MTLRVLPEGLAAHPGGEELARRGVGAGESGTSYVIDAAAATSSYLTADGLR